MQLDFVSLNEARVHDSIPEAEESVPFPLWFAFAYAGKLLYNFPVGTGESVLDRAISVLSDRVDPEVPLEHDASMLGVCCESSLSIVEEADGRPAQWEYSGELYYKGDDLLVDTSIAHGHEDHLHRAAIDIAFEHVRLRMGVNGGVVPCYALGYFNLLRERGSKDLGRNLQFAASGAMLAASVVMSAQSSSGARPLDRTVKSVPDSAPDDHL